MTVDKKWLMKVLESDDQAHIFLHRSKDFAIQDKPVQAEAAFLNFRDCKKAVIFAAKKLIFSGAE